MGFDSNASGTYKTENRFEGSNNPHHRRHNRDYQEGPFSRVGLVQDRDSASLDRNLTSDSCTRLSQSPSPNRYGLDPGNQSILEFSSRHSENKRGALSSENSLSAIAEAEIHSISQGGVLCNVARIEREEGDSLGTHQVLLAREQGITKDGSSGEVHSLLCYNDSMLREDKRGVFVVQFLNRSHNEQPLGDVAREGLECNGSGS
jgi:hypothetical protein